jgi:DNA-directed RNA polymerase specialized sigma24 family protein
MNVCQNERIVALVDKYAFSMVRKYPYVDLDDVKQDLWLEILRVIDKKIYKKTGTTSLESFLFRHLDWRMQNWVRLAWDRHNMMKEYVHLHHVSFNRPPIEGLTNLRAKLKPFDQKVFDQFINPDPELLQLVNDQDASRGFGQVHLAFYFDVSQMTISRSVKKIRETAKQCLQKTIDSLLC